MPLRAALPLTAAIALLACGRVGFEPAVVVADGGIDAPPMDAAIDAPLDASADVPEDVPVDAAPDVILRACEDDSGCPECQTCDVAMGRCEPVPDLSACGGGGTCRFGLCCAGCWAGGSCTSGALVSQCGAGGAFCDACEAPTETCVDGACAPRPAAFDLALGRAHACLVRVDGVVHCWGDNASGELGLGAGDTAPRAIPTALTIGAIDVAVGNGFSCAVNEPGELWCWGSGFGAAGGAAGVPTRIGTRLYSQLAAGGGHACAIARSGELYCWGDDSAGQLGLGGPGLSTSTPTRVGSATDWSFVSAGERNTCGIRSTIDEAYCWGNASRGALGDGCVQPGTVPTRVVLPVSFERVWAGTDRAWARSAVSELYAWGDNTSSALGIATSMTVQCTPANMDALSNATVFASGDTHGCMVLLDGRLLCWGAGAGGVLGLGDETDRPEPLRVGTSSWQSVSAAGDHTCGTSAARELFCWGVPYDGGAPILSPTLVTF